jgi:hypothetical protein
MSAPCDIGDFQTGAITHRGLTEFGTEVIRLKVRSRLFCRPAHRRPAGPIKAPRSTAKPQEWTDCSDFSSRTKMSATCAGLLTCWLRSKRSAPIHGNQSRSLGQGYPYGNPVPVTDSDGKTYVNSYYGRGYPQLTGADVYRKMKAPPEQRPAPSNITLSTPPMG